MNIKIYSTPGCPWCDVAKDFFKSHNMDFQDIDVSVDEKAAQYMIKESGQTSVPVIEIDDKIIIGFNKPILEEILGINKTINGKKEES